MNIDGADLARPSADRRAVAVLVNNQCTYDSRVIKGAEELARRGYRVGIFAVEGANLPDCQVVQGVLYRRLPRSPAELRNVAVVARAPTNGGFPPATPLGRLRKRLADLYADSLTFVHLASAFVLRESIVRYADVLASTRLRIRGDLMSRVKTLAADIRNTIGRLNTKLTIAGATPRDHLAKWLRSWNQAQPPAQDADAARRLVSSATRRYQLAVEAFQPDIIHCHDVDCIEAAALLSDQLGCPFIYDVHELCAHRWDRSEAEFRASIARIEEKHIRGAARVVTVSEELADELNASYGVKPLTMYNTPRYGRCAEFDRDLRSDLGLAADTPLAVYTGVLAVTRGLERFIRAMQQENRVHFAMVGKQTPELIDSFAALGKQLQVADRLHFVSAVPFDAVSTYISTANFGVIPAVARTKNQRVGLPNKLFEMMFAGLPILIGDIPQRRRVLEQYGEGTFFPDSEDVDLGPYVAEIALKSADQAFRLQCRRKGEMAAAKIGWMSQMETLFEAYDKILNLAVDVNCQMPLGLRQQQSDGSRLASC